MAELNEAGMSGLSSLPEYKTRGEWLGDRQGRITATKVWALLGGLGFVKFLEVLSDCGSAHVIAELIARGLFRAPKSPPADSLPLVWGNHCEDLAKREWYRVVGAVYPELSVQHGGWHYYPDDTRFAATPDAYVWSDNAPGRIVLMEFKCCWTKPPPQSRHEILPQYLLQVQHQMAVTGASACLLVYYQTLWNEEPVADQPFERPVRLVQFWIEAWSLSRQSDYLDWLRLIRDSPPPRTEGVWMRRLSRYRQRLLDWARAAVLGYDFDLKQSLENGHTHTASSVAWMCAAFELAPPRVAANTQRQRQEEIARALCTLALTPSTCEPTLHARSGMYSEAVGPEHEAPNADSQVD